MPPALRVQKSAFATRKRRFAVRFNISFSPFASRLSPIIPALAVPRKRLRLFLAHFTNAGAFFLAQKQKSAPIFTLDTLF
jgi:hypothetical protein